MTEEKVRRSGRQSNEVEQNFKPRSTGRSISRFGFAHGRKLRQSSAGKTCRSHSSYCHKSCSLVSLLVDPGYPDRPGKVWPDLVYSSNHPCPLPPSMAVLAPATPMSSRRSSPSLGSAPHNTLLRAQISNSDYRLPPIFTLSVLLVLQLWARRLKMEPPYVHVQLPRRCQQPGMQTAQVSNLLRLVALDRCAFEAARENR